MNFETIILNGEGDDDDYDNDILTSVSEKVFFNWLQKVGGISFNGDEEDETSTNFYNSIKEITKSTYIYKINPKIRINVTKKEDGSEYGGITDEKQVICNHYLRQLCQKEIEW